MKYFFKISLVFLTVSLAILLNVYVIEPWLIPDPCYYHTNILSGWKSYFYHITAISNGHPEPNWMNWLLTILIGAYIGIIVYKAVKRVLFTIVMIGWFVSCSQIVSSDKKIESKKVDEKVTNEQISSFKKTNEFAIKFQLVEKQSEVKLKKPIIGGQITYLDQELIIQLLDKNQQFYHQWKIEKQLFEDIIPEEEMPFYEISTCHLEATEELYWLFSVNICQPDTDICYRIELKIFANKTISWREIEED
ncbi:MAG: DUF4738 domain-containing protein [Flavobacterium sp.]